MKTAGSANEPRQPIMVAFEHAQPHLNNAKDGFCLHHSDKKTVLSFFVANIKDSQSQFILRRYFNERFY
jgi:hypothetical protein